VGEFRGFKRELGPACRLDATDCPAGVCRVFSLRVRLGGLFPRMGEIQQRMGVGEGALEIVVNVDADRAAPRKLNDAPT